MVKKQKGLADELLTAPVPNDERGWFGGILDQDVRDDLLRLRQNYQSGEYGPKRHSRYLHERVEARYHLNITLCQFRRWLGGKKTSSV